MHRFISAPLGLAALIGCGQTDAPPTDGAAPPSPPQAIITAPASGDSVAGSGFLLQLDVRNLTLRPAGTVEEGTGHHHIFLDRDLVPEGEVIPAESGVVHLGAAQTEHAFEDLPPGEHRLIAVLGDHEHRRIPGSMTDTVTVVTGGGGP